METLEQKLYRLRRLDNFKKIKELNKLKLKNSNINYKRKNISYDILPNNEREFIENKKVSNEVKINNKKLLDPEFINISSMRPENQLIIKDNLEDVYNSGDIVPKDVIKAEFDKIDLDFKKNLLSLMNIKDADIVIDNFINDFTFKRFFNINFPDLKKQLKEKYTSLDVKEFLFFIKEYYKNPKTLILKNAIMKKFNQIRKEIKILKRKIKQKQLKYNNDKAKLNEYKNLESSVDNFNEDIEEQKENNELFNNPELIDEWSKKLNLIIEAVSESDNISVNEEKKKN